jgi:hypothetical protein
MQPLDRELLAAVFTAVEMDRLEELLARRLSLCDEEATQLARELDESIARLIGNRGPQITELAERGLLDALRLHPRPR